MNRQVPRLRVFVEGVFGLIHNAHRPYITHMLTDTTKEAARVRLEVLRKLDGSPALTPMSRAT